MQERLPVVRQVHWISLIPQVAAIVGLTLLTYGVFPRLGFFRASFIAALGYLIFNRLMRSLLTRDHILGMRAYHAQQFDDAILHFDNSYRFFSTHRKVDAWRSLLLGVASRNPYRIIALCNKAYCYGQMGRGPEAIKLYEQVLGEDPNCLLAQSSLTMLRAGSATAADPGPNTSFGLERWGRGS
jgi:tetratricopeptide (TPR) repeat protein